MFIDLTKYKSNFKDDIEMSSYILEKGNVALVPGSSFGKDFWARLSYCVSEDTLSEGVKRINEALRSL
jgi:L-aspartate aminotransferase (EC 2.6.1.1)